MKILIPLFLLLLPGMLWAAEDIEPAGIATPTSGSERMAARLAEIRSLPLEGEQLQLMTAEGEAFAIYLPDSSGKRLGAVVLLHDHHKHLLDPPFDDLRRGLSRHGWDTLTIQLPTRRADENPLNWLDRSKDHLNAAQDYLEGQESGPKVLLAQGSGALLATDWLFNATRDKVLGLIALSMDGSANEEPRLDGPRQLAKVNVPVLDIYATHDSPLVRLTAARRAREAQRPPRDSDDTRIRYRDIATDYDTDKGNLVHFRQLQIIAQDHTFHPNQELLLRAVRGWLLRHPQSPKEKTP